MKKTIAAFGLLFLPLTSPSLMAQTLPPEHYLKQKIPPRNHRYCTFHRVLQLLNERNVKTIVETGTSRLGDKNYEGDGGSTIIYAQWAKDNHAEFYSVDLSQENLNQAEAAVHKTLQIINDNIHFVCSDSVSFLENFKKPIDFLYLDSYDFEIDNPLPSQRHHLYEIQAAYHLLTENSIVMIDDCALPHGGKGKLIIQFLLDRGWKILENHYQVILVYPQN